jgi:Transglutaminase-like enzymes, putative cysteine proteases
MRFRVSCRIKYEIRPPVTLLFAIRPRASDFQRVVQERLVLSPRVGTEVVITEPDHNRFDRVRVTEGRELTVRYEAEVERDYYLFDPETLRKVPPAHLNQAQLPFLLPSRYCQSDRLARFAWQKFGAITDVYDQVLAITDWIHTNVEYVPGSTNSSTSAYDTPMECAGVCRDFAHLGIALCRALTIPARYFAGYAHQLNPPDFHACFEAFIGGHWILFDATRLAPPNGLVRIGSGRDAADVSVCTAFGIARSVKQDIRCECLDAGFQPIGGDEIRRSAFSLEGERT